jgi:UDP-N-acetylglucosamine--N-acetylmuramyl-(pentapeptide) pyrophosphoryl-undecaprenol N-acetylglucosamine transferase
LIPKSPLAFLKFFSDLSFCWKILNPLKNPDKPDAILAFGGYPVFPALLWSLFNKIPVFLHEQNSKAGLITRLFAPFSQTVMHSFPKKTLNENEIITGNPLRTSFLVQKQPKAIKKNKNKTPIKNILITGGSQGAGDLNKLYESMVSDMYFKDFTFTISTGEKNFKSVKSISKKRDIIFPFIKDMPGELLKNDLIICRSGSGSVYESLWSKKPVIFFPYPHATGNHQSLNAESVCIVPYYNLIDIRPFNEEKAKERVKQIINNLNYQYDFKFVNSNFPLNARENISSLLIEFISKKSN